MIKAKNSLIGSYNGTIDNKGRLSIPAEFRRSLGGKAVILYLSNHEHRVEVFSPDMFEKFAGDKVSNEKELISLSRDSRKSLLDKQGRTRIPKKFIDDINLSKKVEIIGLGEKILIQNISQEEK